MVLLIIFAVVTPLVMSALTYFVITFFDTFGPAGLFLFGLAGPILLLGASGGVLLLSLAIFLFISRSWRKTGILLVLTLAIYVALSSLLFPRWGFLGYLFREAYQKTQSKPDTDVVRNRTQGVALMSAFLQRHRVESSFGIVNVRNGNYFFQQTDFDSGVALKRSYNSISNAPFDLIGRGWSFTYGARLLRFRSSLLIWDSDGAEVLFDPEPPSSGGEPAVYKSPAGQKLEILNDGTTVRTFPDGSRQIFGSADGLLKRIVHPDNQALELSYRGRQLTVVKSASGQSLLFSYSPDGIMKSVTDGEKTITYEYDSRRDLIKVTYPDGNQDRFTYDDKHNLIHAVLQSGEEEGVPSPHEVKLAYDAKLDRAVRAEGVDFLSKTYEYRFSENNTKESQTIVRDSTGLKPVVYDFVDNGRTLRIDDGVGFKITVKLPD